MRSLPLFAALAASAALAGCATTSPTPRWYLLTPLAASEAPAPEASSGVSLGVARVRLPAYLDRPQIVTRDGNSLRLADFDRWAEPLAESLTRVLAENLSALLATERVAVHPWRPALELDYRVAVEVERFDADAAGEAVLAARWTVFDGGGTEVLAMRRSSYREAAGSSDPAAVVEALSRALAALSRDVAAAIGE